MVVIRHVRAHPIPLDEALNGLFELSPDVEPTDVFDPGIPDEFTDGILPGDESWELRHAFILADTMTEATDAMRAELIRLETQQNAKVLRFAILPPDEGSYSPSIACLTYRILKDATIH